MLETLRVLLMPLLSPSGRAIGSAMMPGCDLSSEFILNVGFLAPLVAAARGCRVEMTAPAKAGRWREPAAVPRATALNFNPVSRVSGSSASDAAHRTGKRVAIL